MEATVISNIMFWTIGTGNSILFNYIEIMKKINYLMTSLIIEIKNNSFEFIISCRQEEKLTRLELISISLTIQLGYLLFIW